LYRENGLSLRLAIFQGFRQLVGALVSIADALCDLVRIQRELGPAIDRLDALELSRHQFEAECQGMLLRADGKLKAATSAEQRERQLKKTNAKLVDQFDLIGEEVPVAPADVGHDAPGSEAPRLPPVRLDLAANRKGAALMAKWGVSNG